MLLLFCFGPNNLYFSNFGEEVKEQNSAPKWNGNRDMEIADREKERETKRTCRSVQQRCKQRGRQGDINHFKQIKETATSG